MRAIVTRYFVKQSVQRAPFVRNYLDVSIAIDDARKLSLKFDTAKVTVSVIVWDSSDPQVKLD